MGPHPHKLKLVADLPVAARRIDHLLEVLGELSDAEVAARLVGFRDMANDLPADDDTMRPTVEALRDVLAAELADRIHAAAGYGLGRPRTPPACDHT